MLPLSQVVESVLGLFEAKDPIHGWPDLVFLIEGVHLFEPIAGADQDALQRNIAPQGQYVDVGPVAGRVLLPGDVANAGDGPAERDAPKGLLQGLAPATLEDDVGSVRVCQLHHRLLPVRRRAVVDHVVRAERLGLFELGVRRRSDNC